MKTRWIHFALIALCSLFVVSMPVSALPLDCEDKCLPSTRPWVLCACGWGTQVTTCGEWFENYCGLLLTQKPSDFGLPNTVLADLGIDIDSPVLW